MKQMKMKQNPLTGNWLCWIPSTSQAYYYTTKKEAVNFCNKVNRHIEDGKIIINEQGQVALISVNI